MATRGQEIINVYAYDMARAISGTFEIRGDDAQTAAEVLIGLVHWCDQRGVDWNDVTFRAGNAIRTHREEAKQDKAGT